MAFPGEQQTRGIDRLALVSHKIGSVPIFLPRRLVSISFISVLDSHSDIPWSRPVPK